MAIVVNLPKTNQTGKNEWGDVEDNDVALKAGVEKAGEEIDGISGLTWYTPKVIATEESRTNTAFGTLTTADEIKSVVLAQNGLLVIGYSALWKESVANAAKAAIFLGATQLKAAASGSEANQVVAATQRTNGKPGFFVPLSSSPHGLAGRAVSAESDTLAPAGTGQTLAPVVDSYFVEWADGGTLYATRPGLCVIPADAGTYAISVKYKASSGSVTAKERKLWVATLG